MMKTNITRRDFLNGTQIVIGAAVGGSLLSPWTETFGSPEGFSLNYNYYPPAKNGLRGSHDGSWEVMHARVMGTEWNAEKVDAEYDLVIVGAGLSGLSSAHFFLEKHPNASVLILDNHDDFGGHAKRNEFEFNGETRIGYGGTEAIDTPSSYPPEALQLLKDLGSTLINSMAHFNKTFTRREVWVLALYSITRSSEKRNM
jgi:spermidine dehydrogenase